VSPTPTAVPGRNHVCIASPDIKETAIATQNHCRLRRPSTRFENGARTLAPRSSCNHPIAVAKLRATSATVASRLTKAPSCTTPRARRVTKPAATNMSLVRLKSDVGADAGAFVGADLRPLFNGASLGAIVRPEVFSVSNHVLTNCGHRSRSRAHTRADQWAPANRRRTGLAP
jgi:hypothetical protein